jgi:hypothetical protein
LLPLNHRTLFFVVVFAMIPVPRFHFRWRVGVSPSAGRALRALFISYVFVRQSEPEDLLSTISELLNRARNSST